MKKLLTALLLATALAGWAEAPKLAGKLAIVESITGRDDAVHGLALRTGMANHDLTIDISRDDLAGALKALDEGRADLVIAYADQLPPGRRLRRVYAREAALIAVNVANSRKSFSSAELANIFAGTLGDWKSLNGSAFSFHRYGITEEVPGEGVFREKVLKERQFANIYRKADPAELMILVGANPNSIALLPAIAETPPAKVALAAVDGVEPTTENLRKGKYPLTRDRAVVFSAKVSDPARFFIQQFQSADFIDDLKDQHLLSLLY